MRLITILYNKYYPLTLLNKWMTRRRNRQKTLTILCGNCMGGYMYHQLGLPFQSPTINLMMHQPSLFKLVSNLEFYRKSEFAPIPGGGRLQDIDIYFTHYNSFEDGCKMWHKRFDRIVDESIFIMASDRDGLTEEMIYKYADIPCKKLVIFTAKKYDLPYCFYVWEFKAQNEVGNLLKKTFWGKWYFETIFDWVGWLNSEDVVAEHFRIKR